MNQPDAQHLSVVWEWHDGSYDRALIRMDPGGWHITGRHGDTRYVIDLDTRFACRTLEVSSDANAITLNRTKSGWIETNAGLIPGSANALDLDLGWTALTNTFPIKRLELANTSHGTFDVLLISQPDLQMQLVHQTYTATDGGWLYENRQSGFSALLTVDKNRLVTEYPGLCNQKDLGP